MSHFKNLRKSALAITLLVASQLSAQKLDNKYLKGPGPYPGSGRTFVEFDQISGKVLSDVYSGQVVTQGNVVLFQGPGNYTFGTLPHGDSLPIVISQPDCRWKYGCTYQIFNQGPEPTFYKDSYPTIAPSNFFTGGLGTIGYIIMWGNTQTNASWKFTAPNGSVKIDTGCSHFCYNTSYLLPGTWKVEVTGTLGFFSPSQQTITATIVVTQQARQAFHWNTGDINSDGARNYAHTWSTNGSTLGAANAWGDLPYAVIDGKSVLKFQVTHNGTGSAGAHITAHTQSGLEPTSWDQANAGKNLSSFNYLRLLVKGSPSSKLTLSVKDAWGNYTNDVSLDNLTPFDSSSWRPVLIPKKLLSNASGNVDWNNIRFVSLFVNGAAPATQFTAYIDSISFIKTGDLTWFNQDNNYNGVVDYSSVWSGNGSTIVSGNQWNNIPTVYQGAGDNSSFRLAINHNGTGYAGANLYTGLPAGVEPQNYNDAVAGKATDDSLYALSMWVRNATPNTNFNSIWVSLTDTYGNHSNNCYVGAEYGTSNWKQVVCYPYDFKGWDNSSNINLKSIRSINFFVDQSNDPRNIDFYIDQVEFLGK